MPNHITTQVEITGTKEAIAKLIKDTKIELNPEAETNQFDFNGIVKRPEELNNTVSPIDVVETDEEAEIKNKEYNEQYKARITSEDKDYTEVRYISEATRDRWNKEFGATSWYDWSNRNWGTKWNAYAVHYTAHTDTKLVLQFDTAWDTPRGIWEALEEQGFTVKGVIYGEMEGYDFIGEDADSVWDAYQNVEVEYVG